MNFWCFSCKLFIIEIHFEVVNHTLGHLHLEQLLFLSFKLVSYVRAVAVSLTRPEGITYKFFIWGSLRDVSVAVAKVHF